MQLLYLHDPSRLPFTSFLKGLILYATPFLSFYHSCYIDSQTIANLHQQMKLSNKQIHPKANNIQNIQIVYVIKFPPNLQSKSNVRIATNCPLYSKISLSQI